MLESLHVGPLRFSQQRYVTIHVGRVRVNPKCAVMS